MARLTTIACLPLLGIACASTLDATNDPFADTGAEPIEGVQITEIDPMVGGIHGGDDVYITVLGANGLPEVFFGNAKLDVTKIDATTLLVTTPDAGTALSVDVTVRADNGEDVWADGFTFSENGGGGGGGGGGGTPTGNIGGYIEFARTQIACPSCLGYSNEFLVQGGVVFHAPTTTSWMDWLPPVGQCAVDPASTPPVSTYVDAGSIAYLKSGSTTIGLPQQAGSGGPKYIADNLPLNDYISNGSYTLEIPPPGGAMGSFTLSNALITAEGFDSISPYELLYAGETGAFTAQVSSTGQTFTWSPAGAGDAFIIDIGAYDYYTGDYLGKIVCHGADTGSMYVPTGSYMDPPLLLTVGLYRKKYTYTTNPLTGDTIEAISTAGYLGTAAMEY